MREVERSYFEVVEVGEYNHFVLFSVKYNKRFEVSLNIYDINYPEVEDVFELPDYMLYMDDGYPIFPTMNLVSESPMTVSEYPKDLTSRKILRILPTKKQIQE